MGTAINTTGPRILGTTKQTIVVRPFSMILWATVIWSYAAHGMSVKIAGHGERTLAEELEVCSMPPAAFSPDSCSNSITLCNILNWSAVRKKCRNWPPLRSVDAVWFTISAKAHWHWQLYLIIKVKLCFAREMLLQQQYVTFKAILENQSIVGSHPQVLKFRRFWLA